jgi:membrane protease YdiL (CAAX protease family)
MTAAETEAPVVILRPAQRVGLVLAIVALALSLDAPNLALRLWLRDQVLHGVSPAVDHIFLMGTLKLAVWSTIGLLILGPRRCGLGAPVSPRQAWLAGVGVGLALLVIVIAALALQGQLAFGFVVHGSALLGNVFSNFYEELIFRGCILGLLLTVLGPGVGRPLAVLIQALLFCVGHRHYPLPLLSAVLLAGLGLGAITVRHRSLWPAYVGHMVVDVLADLFLV